MTTTCSRIQLSRLFDEWNSSGSPLVGTHAATHLWVYRLEIPDESQVDNAVDIKYALVYFGRRTGSTFFYSSSPESTPLWTTTPHVLSENKLRQVIRNLTSDFLPASLPKTIPNEVKEKYVPRVLPSLVSHYGEMLGQEWTPLPPELPAAPAKPVEAVPHTVQFEHAPKVIREVPVLELLQAVCPHCREALRRLLS